MITSFEDFQLNVEDISGDYVENIEQFQLDWKDDQDLNNFKDSDDKKSGNIDYLEGKQYSEDVEDSSNQEETGDYDEDFEEETPKSIQKLERGNSFSKTDQNSSRMNEKAILRVKPLDDRNETNDELQPTNIESLSKYESMNTSEKLEDVVKSRDVDTPVPMTKVNVHILDRENVRYISHNDNGDDRDNKQNNNSSKSNTWKTAHTTKSTKGSDSNSVIVEDRSANNFPVISLQSQSSSFSSAFMPYSKVQKVDPFHQDKLQKLYGSDHKQTSTNLVNENSKKKASKEEINQMLQGMIKDAARDIVRNEQWQSTLKEVSIPVRPVYGGLDRNEVTFVDRTFQNELFSDIKDENEDENIHDVNNANDVNGVVNDLIEQTFKKKTNIHVKRSTVPTIKKPIPLPISVVKDSLIASNQDNLFQKSLESKRLPDIGEMKVSNYMDEYAKLCVDRPDIANKCEEYYATFLRNLIDMCKSMSMEKGFNSIEDLAMNRVLVQHIHKSFASAENVKQIRHDMVVAAGLVSTSKPSKMISGQNISTKRFKK